MNKRTKRGVQIAVGVALLSLLVVGIASASDDDDTKDDGCPDGHMPNPAIAQLTAQLTSAPPQQRAMLQALLAQAIANKCVPISCPDDHHRTAFGTCVKNTPEDPDPGFDPFDPGVDACPDGLEPNQKIAQLRAAMTAAGNRPEDIEATLAKLPQCVPVTCPDGYRRAANGDCEPEPGGNDIDDILKPVPVPGNFYQVKKGDLFFGVKISNGADGKGLSICYMALRRAAYDAARNVGGLDDAAAWAYVQAHASQLKHEIHALRPYLDVMSCSAWLDELYSSWRYSANMSTPGPTGRAITINNPAHAPNLERIRAHEAPARNVKLGKPSDKGKGAPTIADGSWRKYPLLWIPEINLQRLWDGLQSGGSLADYITADGVTWPDGTSRANPPPWVQALGIFDATGTLVQGTQMGCPPSQEVI